MEGDDDASVVSAKRVMADRPSVDVCVDPIKPSGVRAVIDSSASAGVGRSPASQASSAWTRSQNATG